MIELPDGDVIRKQAWAMNSIVTRFEHSAALGPEWPAVARVAERKMNIDIGDLILITSP